MEKEQIDALTQAVLGRIFVELEASGRHVHVTKEQAKVLFGSSRSFVARSASSFSVPRRSMAAPRRSLP